MNVYNYLGENVTGKKVILIDKAFGELDKNNNVIYTTYNYPKVKWLSADNDRDSQGFDKHTNYDGNYLCRVILPKGTILCRYGGEWGSYTTNKGTPYELLGLPYVKETIEYHEYEVIADNVTVFCEVTKGLVAPAFQSAGGAIQYKHNNTIENEIADGKLKEVFLWQQQNKNV